MKKINYVLLLSFLLLLIPGCNNSDYLSIDDDLVLKKDKVHTKGLDQDRYVVMKDYDNLKVHYRIIGKGPIDMVFIPGWTNPLTVYTKQFDFFRNEARCIYIDLPGHGLSDAPIPNNPLEPESEGLAYTQQLMSEAIYTVIKKEGLKKFIGVGFSWGDTPLKVFEMNHPGMIQQLILLDVGIPTWPPMSQTMQAGQYFFFSSLDYDAKLGMLDPTTPPDLLEITSSYWPNYSSPLMANLRYYFQVEENCQPYPWDIPVMVIYNTMDEARENKTKLHYPGSVIHVLGGTHHVIQWVDAETVNQLMDEFMIDRPGNKY